MDRELEKGKSVLPAPPDEDEDDGDIYMMCCGTVDG